jgi:hypothetical protein
MRAYHFQRRQVNIDPGRPGDRAGAAPADRLRLDLALDTADGLEGGAKGCSRLPV